MKFRCYHPIEYKIIGKEKVKKIPRFGMKRGIFYSNYKN